MRLAALEERITQLSNAHFLEGLNPRPESSGAYIAATRPPVYNRFCRIARQILNPVTNVAVESEQLLTLKSTFQLFEYWTFFAVVEEFRKQCPQLNWTLHFGLSENEFFHALKSSSFAIGTDGDFTILIAFQRTFREGVPYSVSRPCRPDFAVEVNRLEWQRPRWIFFRR